MENDKTDGFFRRKSEQFTVTPAAKSWEIIRERIDRKSSGNHGKMVIWKVAAAIILASAIVMSVIRNSDNQSSSALSLADTPAEPLQPVATDSAGKMSTDTGKIPPDARKHKAAVPAVSVKPKKSGQKRASFTKTTAKDPIPILTINSVTEVDWGVTPVKPPVHLPDYPMPKKQTGVVIKYYTNKQTEEKKRKGVGALWAKAQKLHPGNFLGELRAAKNDLFNSDKHH